MQLTLMSNRLFVESFMKIQYNDRPELLPYCIVGLGKQHLKIT